ncbi:hypothetical protein E1091_02835 [Micromonospora fluostatini]|uniref:Uncharacterized protein n=1 Tax=Micromonospora fluostatini TaxID=1629071 RepID=A0ABY2DKQ7_9ACTN|nr:hypothetical protein E1091_02835 [Micromonospora fluostatini]
MSISEVKATLRAAIDAAQHGLHLLDQAADQATRATGRAQALLRGSNHDQVTAARQALAEAESQVRPTRRRFGATAEHAHDYLTRLG